MILGSAQFGMEYAGSTLSYSKLEVSKIIDCAWKNKFLAIDTASDYGMSESILGNIRTYNLEINTKLPSRMPNSLSGLVDIFNISLKKLRRNSINTLFIHNTNNFLKLDNYRLVCDFLKNLKHEEKIKKIGISIYDPKEIDYMKELVDFDVVQAPFNFFDNRIIQYQKRNKSVNLTYQYRSIFLQGLLISKDKTERHTFTNQIREFEKKMWVCGYDDPIQFCVDYCNKFIDINSVIIGVTSLSDLSEIIYATKNSKSLNIMERDYRLADEILANPYMWPK